MLIIILAFLGGVLTIASPCILPVIPFVFARADRPFRTSGLPLLIGMAIAFALVATLASIGGGWVVNANQYGRSIALVVLALFAVTMIWPSIAERVMRPLVRLGGNLSARTSARSTVVESLVLGAATGLLWAPCAGPILGLVLTGAAIGGAKVQTGFLLFAYALGAACSLALVLLGGQKVLNRLKRSLGIEEIIRRTIGVAILVGVIAIAAGLDHGLLTKLSEGSTSGLEQGLISKLNPNAAASSLHARQRVPGVTLDEEGALPALPDASEWVNSPPLTKQSLRGKVVLIDFWTYSCINCLRTLPTVKAWADTYRDAGLVVIGVHTPEFAFERVRGNVAKAIHDLGIDYPVAQDNDYRVWNAFHNEYWPAHYLIDAKGDIRFHHFGEGDDAQTESAIRALLQQKGADLSQIPPHVTGATGISGSGVMAAGDDRDDQSPETYLGTERAERYSGELTPAKLGTLGLNDWGLLGSWKRSDERIDETSAGGAIVFRFHARDAHLVLGPTASGKPVRFEVLLDGKPAGADAGSDASTGSAGTVREQRLYQLVRQKGPIRDRTLTIKFLDPGVRAYAFTFG